jgi:hypothetical protein
MIENKRFGRTGWKGKWCDAVRLGRGALAIGNRAD